MLIPACILALIVDLIFSKIESSLSTRKPIKVEKKSNKKTIIGLVVALIAGILIYQNFVKKEYDISIGSKDFSEQLIMSNMLSDVIEDKTKLKVKRDLNLGGSSIVYEAIKSGSVDGYFDYTGTLFVSVFKQTPDSNTDKVYNYVKNKLEKDVKIYTGKPVGFNNTFTLSVMPETAKKYNLKTISDLKKVSNKLRVSTTLEFANRQDGLPGLLKTYDMKFKSSTPIDGSSRFLALSQNKADVIDAYSTDGLIEKFKTVILEDDKNYFPPYYAVPLIRQETLDKYPELYDVLKIFENLVTDDEMRQMNYRVDELGDDPKDVAHDFLKEKKIID